MSFGENTQLICLSATSVFRSNTSRGGLAPNSSEGSVFFLSGNQTCLNVAAGVDTGCSFNHVGSIYGSVDVYGGLNGTGALLASITLTRNLGACPGYGAGFCVFGAAGVNFAGTATSVSSGGVATQIVFDDSTFGSATPSDPGNNVPEPASLARVAMGQVAAGASRQRRRQA